MKVLGVLSLKLVTQDMHAECQAAIWLRSEEAMISLGLVGGYSFEFHRIIES